MSDITVGSVWVNKIHEELTLTVTRNYGKAIKGLLSDGRSYDESPITLLLHYRPENNDEFCDRKNQELKDDMSTVYDQPDLKGRKDDHGKRRYSLLPKGTVNSVVDVLEYGSKKYADDNWQKVTTPRTRYYNAAMRHIDEWLNGELEDAETGLPHLAHAICCLMFLMWFDSE